MANYEDLDTVTYYGPMEVEFDELEIASWTREELKGVKELSRGCWEWIFLIRSRVLGLDLWRKWDVNCLAKAFAVDLGLEKVLLPKEIGWFGGTGEDLPEIDLIKEKSLKDLICDLPSRFAIYGNKSNFLGLARFFTWYITCIGAFIYGI